MNQLDQSRDDRAGAMELQPGGWPGATITADVAGSSINFLEIGFLFAMVILGVVALCLYHAGFHLVAGLFFGFPLVAACFINPRVAIYVYAFWQSWDPAVGFGQGNWITPAKLFAVVVLLSGVIHLGRYRRTSLSACKSIILWLLALCGVALLSVAWSYAPLASARFAGQMVVQWLLLLIMVKLLAGDRGAIKRFLIWLVLGGVTASLYVSVFGMQQHGYGRATLSGTANPNSVGLAISVALSAVALLWVTLRGWVWKAGAVLAGLIMLLGIFQTGSRSAVGAVLLGYLAGAVFFKGTGIFKRLGVLVLIGGLLFGSVYGILHSGMLDPKAQGRLVAMFRGKARTSAGEQLGGADSRMAVWKRALRTYADTDMVGTGVGATASANFHFEGIYEDVHSSFLGSLTQMGVLGLIAFLGVHLFVLGSLRGQPRYIFVPLLILFVTHIANCIAHTTYTTKWFWLPLTLLIVVVQWSAIQRQSEVSQDSDYAGEEEFSYESAGSLETA